jgi:hypothetical protein
MAGTIEFIIDAEGDVQLHVQGVKGESCTKLTSDIERALGNVKERKLTEEYKERPLKQAQGQRAGQH